MKIEYKPIRKVNKPISRLEAKSVYSAIDQIDCGYVEVLEKYGPGTVAGEIGILHPQAIEAATTEAREYLQADAEIPPEVNPDWLETAIVLGSGKGRRTLLYMPSCPKCLLIYDGDFDKVFVNKWGFSDPRFGFHGKDFFHGRDYELIFDSGLNCGSMQAVREKDKFISTMDAAGEAVSRWFVPGDMTRGDLQVAGETVLYLTGLGGDVHISTHPEMRTVVNMMTMTYDLSERKNAEAYMAKFKKCGYKIYDFDTEKKGSK